MAINNRTGIHTLFAANTYTTSLAVPAVTASLPTGANTTAAIEMAQFPAVRLSFGGTDTDNQTVNYQIIGWTLGNGVYVPKVLALGLLTLSATTMVVAGLDTAATLLVDTITETLGLGGVLVRSPASERMADITVWPANCQYVTVETDRATGATAASCYYEMLDEGSAASVSATFEGNIGNVGLLNTSEVEVNPATEDTLNNLDYVVSVAYTATITATAIIPTAFTATLPADLVRIVLIPRGDMYWKIGGAATASTTLIGQADRLNMPVTKTLADTIQVYAAGAGVVADLFVCTPR
jgi:hypothetical protein